MGLLLHADTDLYTSVWLHANWLLLHWYLNILSMIEHWHGLSMLEIGLSSCFFIILTFISYLILLWLQPLLRHVLASIYQHISICPCVFISVLPLGDYDQVSVPHVCSIRLVAYVTYVASIGLLLMHTWHAISYLSLALYRVGWVIVITSTYAFLMVAHT